MKQQSKFAIVLHGGAGTLLKSQMTAEKEARYREALLHALRAGEQVLKKGGSALDAVVATVVELESCELFNAGKGAVYTHEGHHELDATLMNGADRKAGAVCAVRRIEHPIAVCRKVMDSEFVMLNGAGAEEFAVAHGFSLVENSFFSTDFRKEQLAQAIERGVVQLDHADDASQDENAQDNRYGTVGAVAIDMQGNLAAATSTGGMTNKRYGRVGDSALIGAGTWADNRSCAVSATGHGEYFIRSGVAARIAAMLEFGNVDLVTACRRMMHDEVEPLGGDGGVIAIDAFGNLSMTFNSDGMYRAWVREGEPACTAIFMDDVTAHDAP
jgi:beta-aspartyl-peptidase (threonine type)